MVDRADELECRRAVWIVVCECHFSLEETAIVVAIGIDDHHGDGPSEYAIIFELYLDPFLLLKALVLSHEASLRRQ